MEEKEQKSNSKNPQKSPLSDAKNVASTSPNNRSHPPQNPDNLSSQNISSKSLNDNHSAPVESEILSKDSPKDQTPIEWVDVTSFIKQCSSELSIGQLVHSNNFNLQDAMYAIEINDPKMDSGVNTDKTFTVEERIESGTFPDDSNFSDKEIIGVMDAIFASQISSWFYGYSLSQTVFTCLFMWRTELIKNEVLSVFCKSVLKSCSYIRQSIINADIFEEEDFVSQIFDLDLLENVPEETINKTLDRVETALQNNTSKEEFYRNAFLARLRFYKAFYQIHFHFNKPEISGLQEAKQHISSALKYIKIIAETSSVGVIPPDVFEPLITRRLHASTPARQINVLSINDALDKMRSSLEQLDYVCSIDTCTTLLNLQNFSRRFHELKPDILARSRFLASLIHDRKILGKISMIDFLKESMVKFSIPQIYVDHERTSSCLEHLSTIFLQLFRYSVMNPARRRRKLGKFFEDLGLVQSEVSQVDSAFKGKDFKGNFYFGSWFFDQIVPIMVSFLQLGFELEIYHESEYGYLFWYLDYLFGVQFHNRKYMKTLISDEKGQKSKKKLKASKNLTPSSFEDYLINIQHNLCRGLFRVIFSYMLYFSITTKYSFPFGSEESRFFHRFSPFYRIYQPSALLYSHFLETSNVQNLTAEQLLLGTSETFKTAKTEIEKALAFPPPHEHLTNELKTLNKVATANLVQLQIITSKPSTEKVKLIYDFSIHPHYPIVKIKSI